MIQYGAESLSDAELLAIFLRSGSQQHSAVDLARLLIQHFGHLTALLDAPLQEVSQFHGMGISKYTQLMAVKELGRRYIAEHLKQDALELTNSKRLRDYLRFELLGETQEVFAVLCLDASLRKIAFKNCFMVQSMHVIFPLISYCVMPLASRRPQLSLRIIIRWAGPLLPRLT